MSNYVGGDSQNDQPLQSNEVLREFAPLPYQSLDDDGIILTVNEAWLDLLGYELDEAKGEPFRSFLTSDSADQFESRFPKFKTAGGVSGVEFVMIGSNGDKIPVSFDGQIEYSADGSVTRTHCQFRDISDRVQKESELRRMKRAVDASGHAIYLTDRDGCIEYVNPAFEEITGYSESEAIGSNPRILNSGEMTEEYFEDLWMSVLSGEVWKEETINRRKSGELYHANQTIAPITNPDQGVEGFVAIQTDVTERKQREKKLQKRERMLRKLHETTQEFLAADKESDVYEGIVAAVSNALDLTLFWVMRFDNELGQLETIGVSPEISETMNDTPILEPSDKPLWQVFNHGESRIFSDFESTYFSDIVREPVSNLLAVPIGRFGLILGAPSETETVEDAEIDLIELIATNAEAVLARIEGEDRLAEISQELSSQKKQVGELRSLIESIERIQQRLADSDTKEALERSVCEELVSTDRIDFAWIGHPQTSEESLSPSVWAGRNDGYLDAVSIEDCEANLPAQQAARERKTVSYKNIATRVSQEQWPGDALSRNFNSVLSIPLLNNGVLYGVLTLYSGTESAFSPMYQELFEKVSTLLTDYLSILNIQYADSRSQVLEIEFGLQDSNYPLHVLADSTEATIAFETVLETMEESVRILVSVVEGTPEDIIERAKKMPSISGVEFFGKPENKQLAITLQKPFLASEVTEHGGRLISSVASPDETRIRLSLPEGNSVRPLVESLSNRYSNIKLVSRRKTRGEPVNSIARPANFLTERQYEILKAAYFGGYYDTPRGITGENLASNFGLSNTVVHGHLKAGHRRLLEQLLDSKSGSRFRMV